MPKLFCMKQILYTLVLSFCMIGTTRAQQDDAHTQRKDGFPRWQLNAYLGASYLTNLRSEMDQQYASNSQVTVNYNIRLGKKPKYISIGAGLEESHTLVDGMFTRNNDKYTFELTPNNFKQNKIDMYAVHVPVMFKAVNWKGTATSLGVYVNYIVSAKDRYKIGTEKFKMDAPIQNKWSSGLKMDQEFLLFGKDNKCKLTPVIGYGLQYQVTSYLQGERSFKPLTGYIKLGFALW
jgi:hypothetical protein